MLNLRFLMISVLCFVQVGICEELEKKLEDYPFLYLMITSPYYSPNDDDSTICSAVMLVEECFYLTVDGCFNKAVQHDQVIGIYLNRDKDPLFSQMEMVFEKFIVKTKGLYGFVVLQRQSINIVTDQSLIHSSTIFAKNPYDVKNLLTPRIILASPVNPRFSNCYTIGWASSERYILWIIKRVRIKYGFRPVESTVLYEKDTKIMVQRDKDENNYEIPGTPLICEQTQGNSITATALVGIFNGGDKNIADESITSYSSFIGSLNEISRWANGINVSVQGNLHDWTLWPELPKKHDFFSKSYGSGLRGNLWGFFVYFIFRLIISLLQT